MRILLFSLCTLIVSAINSAADAGLDGLVAADDERVASIVAGDSGRMTEIFSDDLHYAHSNGVTDTKASLISAIASGRLKYHAISYQERLFDILAPGVALMKGRSFVKVTTAEGPVDASLSFLAVWQLEKGKWRFRAWQSCKVPAPLPAAATSDQSPRVGGTLPGSENESPRLPGNWNPKAAGDKVLAGIIKVTTSKAKGAHDADFVMVGERAYVVEHDNDIKPGHGAGKDQYCVLTVINIGTMGIERVVPLAASGQAFANETLPVGACFVPRIIQLNSTTLRCFFCCEDQSGKSQSQTWYRDFDLGSLTFTPEIHRMKLKTADGTHDMQPQYFHADALRQGFKQPAKAFGFYLIDSFKNIDGRIFLAINNFPGAQNALATLNEERNTIEVLGHYNEPAELRLTESSVNRLPDGTWMAICRAESGDRNYVFTTSRDGRMWTKAEPRPFVVKGSNSKPTFDKFNGVYYLGWQEASRVSGGYGVGRYIFNVDVSSDGVQWERKYRFESPESFQYPTFRQHDGAIWFTVTQGSGGSTDRIMFGRLE